MFAATTVMKSKSIGINVLLTTAGLNAIGKVELLENQNNI